MNDPFLMSVLHRLANVQEQLETLFQRELALNAVGGDRNPAHELHHRVGLASANRNRWLRGRQCLPPARCHHRELSRWWGGPLARGLAALLRSGLSVKSRIPASLSDR